MACGRQVHMVGVGGVGMSALAQVLLWGGWRVTGSDRFWDMGRRLPVLERLGECGVEIFPQDGRAIGVETAMVVYSTAIEGTNPEVVAARRLGVPLYHRAEVLAEVCRGGLLLAVAGTSGKTTTAGMLGHALTVLGADPRVVCGGELVEWGGAGVGTGAVRRGGGPWVVELDESDRSFLQFRPAWSVVTNVSCDHFGMGETVELFREYVGGVREGVICGEGVGLLLGVAGGKGGNFFIEPGGEICADGLGGCVVGWRGVEIRLRQVGRHAGLDAILAAELCVRLGYGAEETAMALGTFGGVRRRMEEVGCGGGVRVFDDYAHNAAKIGAALGAAGLGGGRVLAIWRPHGYGPLRKGMGDLAGAFTGGLRGGDRLWLLPVFDAGGTARRDVGSGDLAAAIVGRGGVAAGLPSGWEALEAEVVGEARAGDVVLVMGARDPELPLCARRLAAALKKVPVAGTGRGRGRGDGRG